MGSFYQIKISSCLSFSLPANTLILPRAAPGYRILISAVSDAKATGRKARKGHSQHRLGGFPLTHSGHVNTQRKPAGQILQTWLSWHCSGSLCCWHTQLGGFWSYVEPALGTLFCQQLRTSHLLASSPLLSPSPPSSLLLSPAYSWDLYFLPNCPNPPFSSRRDTPDWGVGTPLCLSPSSYCPSPQATKDNTPGTFLKIYSYPSFHISPQRL